jgi:hypothetical protein
LWQQDERVGPWCLIRQVKCEDVPDGISAEDHAAGLTSSRAKLAAYLE